MMRLVMFESLLLESMFDQLKTDLMKVTLLLVLKRLEVGGSQQTEDLSFL